MDIRINLLPPEIQQQRLRLRRQKKILAAGLVVLCFLLGVYAALHLAVLQARQELARLQAERQALQAEMAAYRPYEQLQAQTNRLNGLYRAAMGTPPDYYKILEGIGLAIPPDVWLTDFQAAEQTGGTAAAPAAGGQPAASKGELVIRGNALNHAAVARWLTDLQQIPGLADIRCRFIDQADPASPYSRFEIKAILSAGRETPLSQAEAGGLP
ncbi:PilN domain-containing protein [Desulforamulus hydrothermalis]|uniref:Fimbrial assembly family protein n=1 Tax=Desulforamulus hydrothermalis Lam5 = DSM 18033 TaxID=1121428 RepID=K8E079_9FIRM|nr:PilN domain-containing protein [Desulforamulus hydrothermalis]CCO08882.1 conserved exported hypothetical protein [Desulforamulus hydrothermalis Lam5 = DSM 18033]SHG73915.1 type IV pilus assembly protein PilN [Desulforamulus hydrothermalis Lam5 = DSM 18033]